MMRARVIFSLSEVTKVTEVAIEDDNGSSLIEIAMKICCRNV